MILCVCKAVSDRAVRAAREAGAHTVAAMAAVTGAGTDCGCCQGAIQKILDEPCRPVPCAGCPRHAAADETVPARIAAERVKAP